MKLNQRAVSSAKALSEPQACLLRHLQRGAVLTHEVNTTGRSRLTEPGRARTIHPATVQSLLDAGVLTKNLFGECRLASATGADTASEGCGLPAHPNEAAGIGRQLDSGRLELLGMSATGPAWR